MDLLVYKILPIRRELILFELIEKYKNYEFIKEYYSNISLVHFFASRFYFKKENLNIHIKLEYFFRNLSIKYENLTSFMFKNILDIHKNIVNEIAHKYFLGEIENLCKFRYIIRDNNEKIKEINKFMLTNDIKKLKLIK